MANYLFLNQFCKSLKEQVQKYKLGWFFGWTDTFANFSYGKFQVVETLLTTTLCAYAILCKVFTTLEHLRRLLRSCNHACFLILVHLTILALTVFFIISEASD